MIDRLQVAVRLRGAFEAADLGLRLVRRHWKPIFASTLLLVAPLALALGWLFRDTPWVMPLLIWWLKPLWDRPILHILARSTFGEFPGVRDTLKALPSLYRRGAVAGLFWRRLGLVRSLLMPVWQLEGQSGDAYRRRRSVLVRRGWMQACLLTLTCFLFQIALIFGLFAALELFVPKGSSFSPAEKAFEGDMAMRNAIVDLLLQITPVAAMIFIEPFYVAGGFGLYLNRRVELEGWDIELAFRRLGARLSRLAAGAMLLLALALPLRAQEGAEAAPSEAKAKARAVLQEVQRQPEFQTERTKEGWHWKEEKKSDASSRETPAWLKGLMHGMAAFGRAIAALGIVVKVGLILLAAAVLGWFLWTFRHVFMGEQRLRLREERPTVLFGLDLRPESLPSDVAAAALALWRRGEARAALALLYRASLADLVHRSRLELPRGATEGECLRAAATVLSPEGTAYFRSLTFAWQGVAYADRPAQNGETLCTAWPAHFRRA